MKLEFKFDDPSLVGMMKRMEAQVRYAVAVALTRVAQDCQKEVIAELPNHFTIRSGWVAKGIRAIPANKTTLTSYVNDVDEFMVLQETGGEKHAGPGGESMGIPVNVRSNPRQMLLRGKLWPSDLLKLPSYFIAPMISGSTVMGLWYRTGKKRHPIELMYRFSKKVNVKDRFHFADTVRNVANKMMQVEFEAALKKAIETMR